MTLVTQEELDIEGNIYIKETYDNGTTVTYLKPEPIPEPIDPQDLPPTQDELLESIALNTEYLVVLAELGGSEL